MKKLLLIVAILVASWTVKAQDLTPTASTVEYRKNTRPCVRVSVSPDDKDVEKAWKSYVKDKFDVKFKSKKGVLYAEKVVVSRITSKAIDFFTKIDRKGDVTEIKIFAALGYDIFVNDKDMPEEFKSMKIIAAEFLKEFLPKYHADMISAAQKEVANFTKEEEKLKSNIQKDKSKIEDLKKEIAELEGKLKTNEANIKKSKEVLEKRNAELKTIQNALNRL